MSAKEYYIEKEIERNPEWEEMIRDYAEGSDMKDIFALMEGYKNKMFRQAISELKGEAGGCELDKGYREALIDVIIKIDEHYITTNKSQS